MPAAWPPHPTIYEINAWTWLAQLRQKHGPVIHLGTIPDEEWDQLAALGVHAIWLMGVWQRSPVGTQIALEDQGLQKTYRQVLPDFAEPDVVGSPYCIYSYRVEPQLGGQGGLLQARKQLAKRGLLLLLDFVPNHVAPDHPWLGVHPDYFLTLPKGEKPRPGFLSLDGLQVAQGRDPYFPPWTDTAQLNAFSLGYRRASQQTLLDIAELCDGVRCDMAMLMLNRIFAQTWGELAGSQPPGEYWPGLIQAVRSRHPQFVFVAEVYWGTEQELVQLGFDLVYDKGLYDAVVKRDPAAVQGQVDSVQTWQKHLLRFIENHDEPRAAQVLDSQVVRAATVVSSTLPGALLVFQGQQDGARKKIPVQLGRVPKEDPDVEFGAFCRAILHLRRQDTVQRGFWSLCPADSPHLCAWSWWNGDSGLLVVTNLSTAAAAGRVQVPLAVLAQKQWRLQDEQQGFCTERSGDEMMDPGLHIELEAGAYHLFAVAVAKDDA